MSKSRKLIEEVRKTAWNNRNGLFVPRTEGDHRTNWPMCLTCKREVEAVEMRNQNSTSVELWARCHGKEDWFTVKYPYHIGGNDEEVSDHLRAAMTGATFFDPTIPNK